MLLLLDSMLLLLDSLSMLLLDSLSMMMKTPPSSPENIPAKKSY
jgi:hypothetical protein